MKGSRGEQEERIIWEGKDIGKHLKKIMKLSIELIGDNDKDNKQ